MTGGCDRRAQVLSEIGYLLRQDPKEVYRARAFSAAAWLWRSERPDSTRCHKANKLTSIEGVGEGIAKVLAGLVESGQSSYWSDFAPRRTTRAR